MNLTVTLPFFLLGASLFGIFFVAWSNSPAPQTINHTIKGSQIWTTSGQSSEKFLFPKNFISENFNCAKNKRIEISKYFLEESIWCGDQT